MDALERRGKGPIIFGGAVSTVGALGFRVLRTATIIVGIMTRRSLLKDRADKSGSTKASRAGETSEVSERFEVVAVPHLDAVYKLAWALTGNHAEADDLVQETFARALRAFGQFELRDYGARPWLLKILQNVFFTECNRRRHETSLPEDVGFDDFADRHSNSTTGPVTIDSVNWELIDDELNQAVAGLQPEYRMVLLLWAFEGLSYTEIAEVCECALGTVMSRLHRARAKIKHQLAEYTEKRRTGAIENQ